MSYQYKGARPERTTTKRADWRHWGTGCGSPAGYAEHIRQNTEKCAPCRQANSEYRRIIRRKKRNGSMKTVKGYTLTAAQAEHRNSFAHYLMPGPGYRRDIRDDLQSLQYAETAEQVDYWLEQAEAKTYDYR